MRPARQVLGDVLPVLGQLQGGAYQVGEPFPVRGSRAEDVQHDAADGVGGQPAVGQQLIEGLVAGDVLVVAVGLDQVAKGLGRDGALRDGGCERLDHLQPGDVAAWAGIQPGQIRLEFVQQPQPLTRRGLVPHVVGRPGEAVDGSQVLPMAPWQQAERDWKVLGHGLCAAWEVITLAGSLTAPAALASSDRIASRVTPPIPS